MKKLIGVYGASGFGREVVPLVKEQYPNAILCFIDDSISTERLNGLDVYGFEAFLALPNSSKAVVLAIADSKVREKLATRCESNGLAFAQIEASSAIILDEVELGEGAILTHFTHLTSNIKIGKQFHANIYSYVAHDCVIGDYVTFAPSVKCNGNVHIEDHAYIGTGAILRQGTPDKPLRIGKGAVVGMGAVVTKDVPEGVTVVGNPARILERK